MIFTFIQRFKNFFLDVLFPPRCAGCFEEGDWLCLKCFEKIKILDVQVCPVCRKSARGGQVCSAVCKQQTNLDGLLVAAFYHENLILEKTIKRFKYRFSSALSERLGEILTKVFSRTFKLQNVKAILTPVPLHNARLKWRGFNQSEFLAEFVATKLNYPWQYLLKRIHNTPPQAKLSKAERHQNLQDAFEIINFKIELPPFVILIDDVAATGATLEECAKVLKNNGAKKVWGLVLARG